MASVASASEASSYDFENKPTIQLVNLWNSTKFPDFKISLDPGSTVQTQSRRYSLLTPTSPRLFLVTEKVVMSLLCRGDGLALHHWTVNTWSNLVALHILSEFWYLMSKCNKNQLQTILQCFFKSHQSQNQAMSIHSRIRGQAVHSLILTSALVVWRLCQKTSDGSERITSTSPKQIASLQWESETVNWESGPKNWMREHHGKKHAALVTKNLFDGWSKFVPIRFLNLLNPDQCKSIQLWNSLHDNWIIVNSNQLRFSFQKESLFRKKKRWQNEIWETDSWFEQRSLELVTTPKLPGDSSGLDLLAFVGEQWRTIMLVFLHDEVLGLHQPNQPTPFPVESTISELEFFRSFPCTPQRRNSDTKSWHSHWNGDHWVAQP